MFSDLSDNAFLELDPFNTSSPGILDSPPSKFDSITNPLFDNTKPSSPITDNTSSFIEPVEKHEETHKSIVKTPNWIVQTKKEPKNIKEKEPIHFSIVRKHMRMEVIEVRINDGVDEVHLHPCYSPGIEYLTEDLGETKQENQLKQNYRFCIEERKIPNFWPKREWDQDKDCLNDLESAKLAEEITRMKEKVPIEFFNIKDDNGQEEVIPKKTRRRKVEKQVWVEISMLDYETDQSDDNTDWDALDL